MEANRAWKYLLVTEWTGLKNGSLKDLDNDRAILFIYVFRFSLENLVETFEKKKNNWQFAAHFSVYLNFLPWKFLGFDGMKFELMYLLCRLY